MTFRRLSAAKAALLVPVLSAALWLLRWAAPPGPPVRSLAEFGRWVADTPADQVVTVLASLLGWGCACYLTGGTLLLTLGRLPGCAGAVCRAVGTRVTPVLLRRMVEGVLGAALASGSLAAAVPAGATPIAAASVTSAEVLATAATPATPATPGQPPAATPGAGRANPASGQPKDTWPDLDRPGRTSHGPVAAARPPAEATPGAGATTVVVRPGDTLWGIARRELGGAAQLTEVAAEWPRWYAANRAVIGSDPDLLYPGQVLAPPD